MLAHSTGEGRWSPQQRSSWFSACIPLGTVLWEEVAFRGVLLAALTRLVSVCAATVISAAVFGIRHAGGPVLRGLAVLLACLFTVHAGVLFA